MKRFPDFSWWGSVRLVILFGHLERWFNFHRWIYSVYYSWRWSSQIFFVLGHGLYEPILICEVGSSSPRQENLYIVYFMGKVPDASNAVPRTIFSLFSISPGRTFELLASGCLFSLSESHVHKGSLVCFFERVAYWNPRLKGTVSKLLIFLWLSSAIKLCVSMA